ncbi:MAG: alcohol dehydrogenase catalytic domain-containing protein [Oscillospiraceae bacterium]|nr:alcohol dehydrogenase catalytic domain-containing protein [Oscillospiraceae bacterium]
MLRMTLVSPRNFSPEEVSVPQPGPGQVLLKIKRIGICGSDIHAYYGLHPFIDLPITPGHEFSAVVESSGKNAGAWKPGDRVTVMPQIFCRDCPQCRSGRYNICQNLKVIGCQCTGAAQEYLTIDHRLLLRLPDLMSFDQGAMLEPLAVGVHACRRVDISGKRVLVQGAGTIGSLAAQSAQAMGAEAVMITDISRYRLDLAKSCGVEYTALPEDAGKFSPSLIIECVGTEATVEQAIQLAPKGSDIIIAGVFSKKVPVNMGLVQDKELRLNGTLMYTLQDWESAADFAVQGQVKLENLIAKRFTLPEIAQAFRYIEENRDTAVKVIIDV